MIKRLSELSKASADIVQVILAELVDFLNEEAVNEKT